MGCTRNLTPETTTTLLRQAKAGDDEARTQLIVRYGPLLLRMASRATGRYIYKEDDEAAIALIAFNEAITSFDPDRGRSFVRFAQQVIRRRLVDHYRRHRRTEVVMSDLEREGEAGYADVSVQDQATVEEGARTKKPRLDARRSLDLRPACITSA